MPTPASCVSAAKSLPGLCHREGAFPGRTGDQQTLFSQHNKFPQGLTCSHRVCHPTEAVWACTSCGACVDICPVGNEPMRDILDIRRDLVLMENTFPKQLETAFRGMERTANPWGVPPNERMKWAEGLKVPTIEQNPEPDILWWVGCAPATEARAQKTARAFAHILNSAGVNFAVLGESEQCTGDSARRSGREDIFFGLATANVELLNEIKPGASSQLARTACTLLRTSIQPSAGTTRSFITPS